MSAACTDFFLALDCSTARGSVTLANAVGPLWQLEIPAGRGHGGELFAVLDRAMNEVRATRGGTLSRIVVGLGPGSYSGVRQAVAAAVGLAAATGATLMGAPSPAALPVSGLPEGYRAVSDARRGTFYHTAVRDGVCIQGPELLPDAAALAARLAEHPPWPVCAVESALPDGLLPDASVLFPEAYRLLCIPEKTYRLPPLEPIYLRPVSITLPNPAKPVAP